MTDDAARETPRKPIRVSNQALAAFSDMFIGWLDDNISEVEFGHSGDVKELSRLCARWAAEHLK